MKTTTFLHPLRHLIFIFPYLALAGLFPGLVRAQVVSTNQWTWVNGDSTLNQHGIYGTKGVAASTNKPSARLSYASWVDSSGNFWMFGGTGVAASGGTGELNDLWEYNHSTWQWTWVGGDSLVNPNGKYGTKGVAAAANWPGGRANDAYWRDNSGNIWVFGGSGQANSGGYGYLSDLWKYSPPTGQWTWIGGDSITAQHGVYGSKGSPAAANKPGSGQHQGIWVDGSGNLWLFGGAAYAASGIPGNTDDLWKYNPSTNKWTWIAGDSVIQKNGVYGTRGVAASANTPGVRIGTVNWTDNNHNLWLFAGQGLAASGASPGYLNDLWMFNTTSNKWIWIAGDSTVNKKGNYGAKAVAAAANWPGSRYCTLTWIDSSNNVWMFGGQGYAATTGVGILNDMWEYNTSTGQWTWMRGDSTLNLNGVYGVKGSSSVPNKPGARGVAAGWMDNAGNPWIFGGFGYSASGGIGYLNDLWGYQASSSSYVFLLLPLNLLSFTASPSGGHETLLNWQCTAQPAGSLFDIQRSSDGIHWISIGTQPVYSGCTDACHYRLTDYQPLDGINYYRLQITGITDHSQFSKIVSVVFSSPCSLSWHERGSQCVQIVLSNGAQEKYRVLGMDGRLLRQDALKGGQATLSHLAPGIYIVQIMTSNAILSEKIVAQ